MFITIRIYLFFTESNVGKIIFIAFVCYFYLCWKKKRTVNSINFACWISIRKTYLYNDLWLNIENFDGNFASVTFYLTNIKKYFTKLLSSSAQYLNLQCQYSLFLFYTVWKTLLTRIQTIFLDSFFTYWSKPNMLNIFFFFFS